MQMPHGLLFFFVAWVLCRGESLVWDGATPQDTFAEQEGAPDGLGPVQVRARGSRVMIEPKPGPVAAGRVAASVLALRVAEMCRVLVLAYRSRKGGDRFRLPPASARRFAWSECSSTHLVSPDTSPDSARQPRGWVWGVSAETPTWAETDSFPDQQHLRRRLWSLSGQGRSVLGPIFLGVGRKTSKNRRPGGRMPAWRTCR
jgi:hypothetical protein